MKASKLFAAVVLLLVAAAVPLYAKKEKKEQVAPTKSTATAVTGGTGEVAAYLGDQPITKDELRKAAANQLMRVRQQEYDILKNALDNMAIDKLLDKEATARGITKDELVKAEVDDKAAAPTKEEVDQFYEKNKARFGTRTREEAGPDVERQLRGPKVAERRNAFFKDLMTKGQLRVMLDPPRADVTIPADQPTMGPGNAPVTLVEFSDFQCPFCKRTQPTVDQVLKEYGDKLRFVYMDYPLPMHGRAKPASLAARCAGDQGKYWEMYQNLMSGQGDLSDDDLKKRAAALSLDPAVFGACYDSKKHESAIQTTYETGSGLGVTGTPSFFINGRMIVGAQPIEQFRSIIDEELTRAGTAGGAKAVTR